MEGLSERNAVRVRHVAIVAAGEACARMARRSSSESVTVISPEATEYGDAATALIGLAGAGRRGSDKMRALNVAWDSMPKETCEVLLRPALAMFDLIAQQIGWTPDFEWIPRAVEPFPGRAYRRKIARLTEVYLSDIRADVAAESSRAWPPAVSESLPQGWDRPEVVEAAIRAAIGLDSFSSRLRFCWLMDKDVILRGFQKSRKGAPQPPDLGNEWQEGIAGVEAKLRFSMLGALSDIPFWMATLASTPDNFVTPSRVRSRMTDARGAIVDVALDHGLAQMADHWYSSQRGEAGNKIASLIPVVREARAGCTRSFLDVLTEAHLMKLVGQGGKAVMSAQRAVRIEELWQAAAVRL